MNKDFINNIKIITNNKENIYISSSNFDNFYIANINDAADETSYEKRDNNTLYANYFMLKIKDYDQSIINRLKNKKDIIQIGVNFINGNFQLFDIPKKRIQRNGKLQNEFEYIYINDDNELCILITDKNIKYKKELFA